MDDRSHLLVRMTRLGGTGGPEADYRLDPDPGAPKSVQEILGSAPVGPFHDEAEPATVLEGIRRARSGGSALRIDFGTHNRVIAAAGPEGRAVIDGGWPWYAITAKLRLRADGRGLEVDASSIMPGEGLVVRVTPRELAEGPESIRGRIWVADPLLENE